MIRSILVRSGLYINKIQMDLNGHKLEQAMPPREQYGSICGSAILSYICNLNTPRTKTVVPLVGTY